MFDNLGIINLYFWGNSICPFNGIDVFLIDVYLNNEKIEIIKEYKIKSNIFKEQKGNYEFKIYFNNKLVNLKRFFENC